MRERGFVVFYPWPAEMFSRDDSCWEDSFPPRNSLVQGWHSVVVIGLWLTGGRRGCNERYTAKRSFRETRAMPEGREYGLVVGTTGGDVRYNSVGQWRCVE